MEGNVDKLVVIRMKNQGLSWSLQCVHRLLWVRFLVLEWKLGGWLIEKKPSVPIRIPTKKMNRIVTNLSEKESDTWLQAGLPSLYDPNASHP
jgi:hypothetical protein